MKRLKMIIDFLIIVYMTLFFASILILILSVVFQTLILQFITLEVYNNIQLSTIIIIVSISIVHIIQLIVHFRRLRQDGKNINPFLISEKLFMLEKQTDSFQVDIHKIHNKINDNQNQLLMSTHLDKASIEKIRMIENVSNKTYSNFQTLYVFNVFSEKQRTEILSKNSKLQELRNKFKTFMK